jgi:hypothetical protein
VAATPGITLRYARTAGAISASLPGGGAVLVAGQLAAFLPPPAATATMAVSSLAAPARPTPHDLSAAIQVRSHAVCASRERLGAHQPAGVEIQHLERPQRLAQGH